MQDDATRGHAAATRRLAAIAVSTALMLALPLLAVAMDGGATDEPAAATQPDPEHLRQLTMCKEGLLDRQARDKERRRWAELLLSYDSQQGQALVVELLRRNDRPKVQHTLCQAVGERTRQSPDTLTPAFVAPLIELLGRTEAGIAMAAASTLAEFPGGEVPARLGAIAADAASPLPIRLAAIDALTPNTHRREVVGQLVALLESETPEVVRRAAAALEPASLATYGQDIELWRTWWAARSQLREEDWLAEQLRIYRDRARRTADELASLREQAQRSQSTVEAHFRSFQHELFRALPAESQNARLVEWLTAPLPLVNRGALAIIKARIADEGKRPEGEVLAALLQLLRDGPPDVQREIPPIIQTLNDKAVVDAVLSLLENGIDPAVRRLLFTATGMFDDPRILPALVREIGSLDASPECVREAAIALGRIAQRVDPDPGALASAVAALKQRTTMLSPGDTALRAAALSAMAGLASPEFTPELLDAVESDDATILQPALRGLLAVGDASKLTRFRTLTAHPDSLVRLVAVEAVAVLGAEDADLENLLTRLNPNIEANAAVREMAWNGFREFLGKRPLNERISAADRLRDAPELELRYLSDLADALTTANTEQPELITVVDRLGVVLMSQSKYAEAAARWRRLYELRASWNDPDTLDSGLRWLQAALRVESPNGMKDVVTRLFQLTESAAGRERIVDVVRDVVESGTFTADAARARDLLDELRVVSHRGLPESWNEVLSQAEAKLAPPERSPSSP